MAGASTMAMRLTTTGIGVLCSVGASICGCSAHDSEALEDAGSDASDRSDVSNTATLDVANFPEPDRFAPLPCNGIPAYCARSYDSLAYVTTHASAANADPPFRRFAQDESVRAQLDHGVRALNFEFHENAANTVIC